MFRTITFLATFFLASFSSLQATVTLQFSNSPIGATNFGNSSGVATNGMLWGVIIDSSGNGFQGSGPLATYDAFNPGTSGFLSASGSVTDDYYFATGLSTQTLGAPFFTGVEAGIGAITTAAGVPSTGDGVAGVQAGDTFGLIWLSSSTANNGDNYGFFSSGSFVLQSTGTTNYSSAFTGADPIRGATLTIGGVPEPSRAILVGIGLLGFLMRRRRA